MRNAGSTFVAFALAAAAKQGWSQYKDWRIARIPEDERSIYQRMWQERASRRWRSPWLWSGVVAAFILVGALLIGGPAKSQINWGLAQQPNFAAQALAAQQQALAIRAQQQAIELARLQAAAQDASRQAYADKASSDTQAETVKIEQNRNVGIYIADGRCADAQDYALRTGRFDLVDQVKANCRTKP